MKQFDEVIVYFEIIKNNLPKDMSEISAVFGIMQEEGTLYSLSILMRKLEGFIFHPLLDDILWLLEDYSFGDKTAILDIV